MSEVDLDSKSEDTLNLDINKDLRSSTTHNQNSLYHIIKVTGLLQDSLVKTVTSVINTYCDSLQTSPLYTKALTSCVIAILGELIGSCLKPPNKDGKRELADFKRIAIFGVYGLAFTGPFFHWWYGFLEHNISSYFPPQVITNPNPTTPLTSNQPIISTTSTASSTITITTKTSSPYRTLFINAIKLAINQLIMTPPFLLFTLAYIQYFLTLNTNKTIDAIKRKFAVALLTNWKVWTVAQAINFQVVPLQYRVLFGNIVALWWNIYLSLVNTVPPSI